MERDGTLLLALARMRFLKTREKLLLLDVLGSARAFEALSAGDASRILGREVRGALWHPSDLLMHAEADLKTLTAREISCTFYWDDGYPPLLREIFDPPFMLFYRGNLPERERPAVAIVGTRRPTGRALLAARALGRDFGASGIPVISGLARGIDRAAHEGAVQSGGKTFAVLGCGIETVYPKENRKLAESVLETGGGIVSEYPPGTPALKYNFPERNRIISGLSRAVVVVEAPGRSGALITARFALEQGRDVFVHRDCIGGTQGAGTGALREDGAPVIGNAFEVLRDWGIEPMERADGERDAAPEEPDETPAHELVRNLMRELETSKSRGIGEP